MAQPNLIPCFTGAAVEVANDDGTTSLAAVEAWDTVSGEPYIVIDGKLAPASGLGAKNKGVKNKSGQISRIEELEGKLRNVRKNTSVGTTPGVGNGDGTDPRVNPLKLA